ncbi:STAS domain-containing protein [Streptomyces sp. NPDC048514]|uniref:STAS domain-containing protein n=1 Tax=Streptomyces sp. NPDC048514 TaxID=3365564 RepID=UPI0037245D5C
MFSVQVRWAPQGRVVALRGELDHASAVQLQEAAETVFAEIERPALIVIDCAALEFCDSSGINSLIRMHLRLAGHDGVLRLAAVPASVARVFTLTGLDQVIPMHTTAEEAVTAGSTAGAGPGGDGPSAPRPGEWEVAGE